MEILGPGCTTVTAELEAVTGAVVRIVSTLDPGSTVQGTWLPLCWTGGGIMAVLMAAISLARSNTLVESSLITFVVSAPPAG